MGEYIFSYENYRKLLKNIKMMGTLKDYQEVQNHPDMPFIILRHDVEFSPKRALELAVFENAERIHSTYFFQLTNNAYNLLSGEGAGCIRKIAGLGHHVGLHFHLHGSDSIEEIKQRLIYECDLLSYVLGKKVDRFSFHRPSALVLENVVEIPGIINAYHPLFFTYSKKIQTVDFLQSVKYIADSRNEWSYTEPWSEPCEALFRKYPKIQILCHPYSWTEKGYATLENLRSLIDENREEFIATLNAETKYVKEYLHEL